MSRTLLLVGTRKGLFMLESDADRRKWSMRGAYCEGWPVYHAVFDQDSGAIYAAAASEWHGSSIWRSPDLGETWTQSSEGLAYEDGRRMSKVSSALGCARPRARRRRGAGHLREPRRRRDLVAATRRSTGQPGSEGWDDPANQPPGHLGISAIIVRRGRPRRTSGRSCRASASSRRPTTARRGRRATAVCAPTGRASTRRLASASTSSFARGPTSTGCTSRTTSACTARDDAGATWTEITEGLPTEFGFAAAAHPHDRDTFHVIPLDPGHGRTMPDGQAAVWRTKDAGSSWERLANGLPQENAHLGVLRHGMVGDTYDTPGYYFGTSTGQVYASADDGESWSEIASYLPAISSVEVAILN